jgi:hypothetical protein
MTRPFAPRHLRHGASRAQASNAPAGSRQGGGPTRPGSSPIWFGAIVLGVFALASMLMGALPYLTSPAPSGVIATSAAAEDARAGSRP